MKSVLKVCGYAVLISFIQREVVSMDLCPENNMSSGQSISNTSETSEKQALRYMAPELNIPEETEEIQIQQIQIQQSSGPGSEQTTKEIKIPRICGQDSERTTKTAQYATEIIMLYQQVVMARFGMDESLSQISYNLSTRLKRFRNTIEWTIRLERARSALDLATQANEEAIRRTRDPDELTELRKKQNELEILGEEFEDISLCVRYFLLGIHRSEHELMDTLIPYLIKYHGNYKLNALGQRLTIEDVWNIFVQDNPVLNNQSARNDVTLEPILDMLINILSKGMNSFPPIEIFNSFRDVLVRHCMPDSDSDEWPQKRSQVYLKNEGKQKSLSGTLFHLEKLFELRNFPLDQVEYDLNKGKEILQKDIFKLDLIKGIQECRNCMKNFFGSQKFSSPNQYEASIVSIISKIEVVVDCIKDREEEKYFENKELMDILQQFYKYTLILNIAQTIEIYEYLTRWFMQTQGLSVNIPTIFNGLTQSKDMWKNLQEEAKKRQYCNILLADTLPESIKEQRIWLDSLSGLLRSVITCWVRNHEWSDMMIIFDNIQMIHDLPITMQNSGCIKELNGFGLYRSGIIGHISQITYQDLETKKTPEEKRNELQRCIERIRTAMLIIQNLISNIELSKYFDEELNYIGGDEVHAKSQSEYDNATLRCDEMTVKVWRILGIFWGMGICGSDLDLRLLYNLFYFYRLQLEALRDILEPFQKKTEEGSCTTYFRDPFFFNRNGVTNDCESLKTKGEPKGNKGTTPAKENQNNPANNTRPDNKENEKDNNKKDKRDKNNKVKISFSNIGLGNKENEKDNNKKDKRDKNNKVEIFFSNIGSDNNESKKDNNEKMKMGEVGEYPSLPEGINEWLEEVGEHPSSSEGSNEWPEEVWEHSSSSEGKWSDGRILGNDGKWQNANDIGIFSNGMFLNNNKKWWNINDVKISSNVMSLNNDKEWRNINDVKYEHEEETSGNLNGELGDDPELGVVIDGTFVPNDLRIRYT